MKKTFEISVIIIACAVLTYIINLIAACAVPIPKPAYGAEIRTTIDSEGELEQDTILKPSHDAQVYYEISLENGEVSVVIDQHSED